MQPFVALMRRYCIDYTNTHDIGQIASIMSPDYLITVSGRTMDIAQYREAVAAAFTKYPTLGLTVHDIMMSEDRLALRFSEHAALGGYGGPVAVWGGISLYRWDGHRLVTCRVEQDFYGRDQQNDAGITAPVEPPHPDPWATTRDEPPSEDNERVVRDWLLEYAERPDHSSGVVRHLETEPFGVLLDPMMVDINDVFSAGDRVAASVTFKGAYSGGLQLDSDSIGSEGHMPANLIATVGNGKVTAVEMVRDRWGLVRRLRRRTKPDA